MSEKKEEIQQDTKGKQVVAAGKTAPAKPADGKAARSKEQTAASKSWVMGYAKRECCSITIGMCFLVGGMLSDVITPLFIGKIIDYTEKKDWDSIGELCGYMVIVVFVSAICVGFRASNFNILSERIAMKIRRDYYEAIINKDIKFFDSKKVGDLMSALNSNVQVIQGTLGTNVSMFVRSLGFIIVTLVILATVSVPLTACVFGGLLPLTIFQQCYAGLIAKYQKTVQTQTGQMNVVAQEVLGNIRTVKAFATEEKELTRFFGANKDVYAAGSQKAKATGILTFVNEGVLYGTMIVVIYVAKIVFKNGDITTGEISSFMFYLLGLVFNFMIMSFVFKNFGSVYGAADKLYELIHTPYDIKSSGGERPTKEINGSLEVRNVKFRYPGKDELVLQGVSFSVDNEKNRVVALCGTSGCGKSSLISLVERFYDPEEGEVLFNGQNIKELDPTWYHNQIAIVQQEPILFSGSIGENILYGLEGIEGKTTDQLEDMMDEACKQASAYDFIHDKDLFPSCYDTIVGERGIKLSGGQKQRVAIARALIRKPKLLLLDEATSALDAESEHQVQKAIDVLIASGQQTVIVIAHRLSTIRDANEIIVMKHGSVMERGTHEELVKLEGVYKNLVQRQLVGDEIDKDAKGKDAEESEGSGSESGSDASDPDHLPGDEPARNQADSVAPKPAMADTQPVAQQEQPVRESQESILPPIKQ